MDILKAKNLYMRAKEAYYNSGDSIMPDEEFDKLEDFLKEKCPDWIGLKKTGIKVGKKTEVVLPHFMPSLNKYYPEEIEKYWKKNLSEKYLYMAKLDGSSVLLRYKDGNPIQLVTRGDGEKGKDISFFLPFLKQLPRNISNKKDLYFRCEAIVSKETFKKWDQEFQSNRNMVSGILNRTDIHPCIHDIDFVVLGEFSKNIVEGLKEAKSLGLKIVQCSVGKAGLEENYLKKIRDYKYEADGVVIAPISFYYDYENSDKPKNIVAYKENLKACEVSATVKRIVYQVSHTGRIIPKVEIEPVQLQGVTVKYATCHNAQWMIERKIGPKAVISIVRSGEVIPKIVGVQKEGQLQYPSIPYKMEGVHFVSVEKTDEQKIEEITRFIKLLGSKNIASSSVATLYNKGIKSISGLLYNLSKEDFPQKLQKIFGKVKGQNIFESLHSIILEHHSLLVLMVASNCFDAGIGIRKLQNAVDNGVDFVESLTHKKPMEYFLGEGIQEATAQQIADGLESFSQWYEKNKKYFDSFIKPSPNIKKQGILSNQRITFTGYRDKEQEQKIIELGGEIVNFSSKTTYLLYKENKKSSKVAKAGARAITWEKFCEIFNLSC